MSEQATKGLDARRRNLLTVMEETLDDIRRKRRAGGG